ncbi:Nucleolar GTP-binding protein 2, partial [Intoshia linei]
MAIIKPYKQRDKICKSGHPLNPDRKIDKNDTNKRDKSTIKRLNMYRNFKPTRNKKGEITRSAPFQGRLTSGTVSRIEPNRKWFGNTRVIKQDVLQKFQNEMSNVVKDPYQFVLKQTKLPITLLNESRKKQRSHILEISSYNETFGPTAQRKRPKLAVHSVKDLIDDANKKQDKYNQNDDLDYNQKHGPDMIKDQKYSHDIHFKAGQSRRIWNELYKVLDSSDVIIQVLDARDPIGTRSPSIEKYLKNEKPFKHLIFVLNKCDLVPSWITKRWICILSQEYPTLAFHASITNSFGKGSLIQLLRQFSKLHENRKQISVGFIGYPNVGKSSIINTLRKKKVCKSAPIAGQTKVWQFVTLMKRIFLIDCPGVVQASDPDETDLVLKSIVRVEYIKNPEYHIEELLKRTRTEYIKRHYKIDSWTDYEDFLEQLARKCGKLLKGAVPDIKCAAKMMLNDWQRGKIPYFIKPDIVANTNIEKIEYEKEISKTIKPINQKFDEIEHTNEFVDQDLIDESCDNVHNVDENEWESKESVDSIISDNENEEINVIAPLNPLIETSYPDEAQIEKRLTGKQKRRIDAKKKKNVGKHFYKTTN